MATHVHSSTEAENDRGCFEVNVPLVLLNEFLDRSDFAKRQLLTGSCQKQGSKRVDQIQLHAERRENILSLTFCASNMGAIFRRKLNSFWSCDIDPVPATDPNGTNQTIHITSVVGEVKFDSEPIHEQPMENDFDFNDSLSQTPNLDIHQPNLDDSLETIISDNQAVTDTVETHNDGLDTVVNTPENQSNSQHEMFETLNHRVVGEILGSHQEEISSVLVEQIKSEPDAECICTTVASEQLVEHSDNEEEDFEMLDNNYKMLGKAEEQTEIEASSSSETLPEHTGESSFRDPSLDTSPSVSKTASRSSKRKITQQKTQTENKKTRSSTNIKKSNSNSGDKTAKANPSGKEKTTTRTRSKDTDKVLKDKDKPARTDKNVENSMEGTKYKPNRGKRGRPSKPGLQGLKTGGKKYRPYKGSGSGINEEIHRILSECDKLEDLTCQFCERSWFSGRRVFIRHYNKCRLLDQSKLAPFRCEICFSRFQLDSTLQRHVREIHGFAALKKVRSENRPKPSEFPKPCRYCGEMCHSRYTLKKHERNKCAMNPDVKKAYYCTPCNRVFDCKEVMKRHAAEAHPDGVQIVCPECGMMFRSRSGFYFHKLNRHDKKPQNKYQCTICPKSFITKERLNNHKSVHSEERPEICEHCGKGFKIKKALDKHVMAVHMNKYQFYCQKCGHGVAKKAYLETHVCGRVKRIQAKNNEEPPGEPAISNPEPCEYQTFTETKDALQSITASDQVFETVTLQGTVHIKML